MTSKVQINYKSGRSIEVKCDSFKVTRRTANAEITGIEWSGLKPSAIYIGLNDIESVWEL